MTTWMPIDSEPKDGEPFVGGWRWADTGEWDWLAMRWYPERGLYGDATYGSGSV